MWNLFGKIIKYLEDEKIPLSYYFITFFFVITLRNYFEIYSDSLAVRYLIIFHYFLSYLSVILLLSLIFYYASKVRIEKILRSVLAASLVISTPPILDLLISGGKGYNISYFMPGEHDDLWFRFFTFFGPFKDMGMTPGIRIELFFIIIFSFLYVYYKRRSIFRSLVTAFLVYVFLFLYFALPFLTEALKISNYYDFERSMINSYALILLFLIPWITFVYNKNYFKAILKDIRPFRLLHYILMFFAGVWLAHAKYPAIKVSFDTFSFVDWLFILVAITFAWLFSVITNNIADYKIDQISNTSRPLVRDAIDLQDYKKFAVATFFLSVFFGLVIHFVFFYMMLVFMAIYWIYSMPPLRLKRVPILSKLAIAANTLLMLGIGHLFLTGKIAQYSFDYLYIFLLFFIPLNFIDIKDYEGDKADGIKTMVTWLGLKKAKLIIGFSFLLSYILSYRLIDNNYIFAIFVYLGLMQFYYINRRDYKEKPVLFIYIITLLFYFLDKVFFR